MLEPNVEAADVVMERGNTACTVPRARDVFVARDAEQPWRFPQVQRLQEMLLAAKQGSSRKQLSF